jgi:hypothetical protein
MISVLVLLLTVGCSSSSHSSTAPTAASGKAVRVTYTATSRSSQAEQATVTYTDPLDRSQASVPGKVGWLYTYPRVPVSKPITLEVRVTGPNPTGNTCAIRINGHRVTSQSGHSGAAPSTAVTCNYSLTPSNA